MPAFMHHLRVRYNECDAQGHVFNANYFVYFDVILTELWRETLGSYEALTADGLDLVVAETVGRFRAPAHFDDELEITLEVERLGNTSMVSAIGIARDGEILTQGRIVHIFVRADRLGEKAPIPDHVRRKLQRYSVEDPRLARKEPLISVRKCRGGMSRSRARLRPRSELGHNRPSRKKENMMAKYLLLKHYRGAPASVNDVPMDQWTPEEVSAHMQYMQDFAARLEGTGEFVDSQALSPEGTFVRYDGEGRPPVTDGPFAETKDLIAGWMVIDVETYERALELAGELSAAPGAGGKPIHEWLEVRPFLAAPLTITE